MTDSVGKHDIEMEERTSSEVGEEESKWISILFQLASGVSV